MPYTHPRNCQRATLLIFVFEFQIDPPNFRSSKSASPAPTTPDPAAIFWLCLPAVQLFTAQAVNNCELAELVSKRNERVGDLSLEIERGGVCSTFEWVGDFGSHGRKDVARNSKSEVTVENKAIANVVFRSIDCALSPKSGAALKPQDRRAPLNLFREVFFRNFSIKAQIRPFSKTKSVGKIFIECYFCINLASYSSWVHVS